MTAPNDVTAGPATNVLTPGQKRLVIVGGTGMVGSSALRYALEHLAVGHVTSIGRRPLGISHAKLKEVLHRDFADCSPRANELSGQDGAGSGVDGGGNAAGLGVKDVFSGHDPGVGVKRPLFYRR